MAYRRSLSSLIAPPPEPKLDPVTSHMKFERLEPMMRALPESRLRPYNIDPTIVVPRVLGVVPRIQKLRGEIAKKVLDSDLDAIDQLADRAYALSHADAVVRSSSQPLDQELQQLVSAGLEHRRIISQQLAVWAQVEAIPPEAVPKMHARRGHLDLAEDLMRLVVALRAHWSVVGPMAFFKEDKIDMIESVASRIEQVVGLRNASRARPKDVVDLRVRAWTLVDVAYEEARRAVTYIRWWHGDADDIAPSLRTHGGRKKRSATEVATAEEPELGGSD